MATTETSHEHFAQALSDRFQVLAVWHGLTKYERDLRDEFKDRFPPDILYVT